MLDKINAELQLCYYELMHIYSLNAKIRKNIDANDVSLAEWVNLKKGGPKYTELFNLEKSVSDLMQKLIVNDNFVPIGLREEIKTHIDGYVFMSRPDSHNGYGSMGFVLYKTGQTTSPKTESFETPFANKSNFRSALQCMAGMCHPRTACSLFRKFVYGMFPRLNQLASTVLGLMEFSTGVKFADICTRLTCCYDVQCTIVHEDTNRITTAGNSKVFQWFLDGNDVTCVPAKRSLSDTRGVIDRLTAESKYVYIEIYGETNPRMICWMGFEHRILGIVYQSVEWDDAQSDRIAKGYQTMTQVFRSNVSPVWLSGMFWGLMRANSGRQYVNETGVSVKAFNSARNTEIGQCLTTLTAVASGSNVENLVLKIIDETTRTCYRFDLQDNHTFEWRFITTGLPSLSFGYVK